MKKLNRKGFTLVELLAVIIILAIVVGIAIPSVTSVINGSKTSAMEVAVETAHSYLKKQYDTYNISPDVAGTVVMELITAGSAGKTYTATADAKKLEELGFKTENVSKVFAKVYDDPTTATAKICVRIEEIPQASDYFVTSYWDLNATTKIAKPKTGTTKHYLGNGC